MDGSRRPPLRACPPGAVRYKNAGGVSLDVRELARCCLTRRPSSERVTPSSPGPSGLDEAFRGTLQRQRAHESKPPQVLVSPGRPARPCQLLHLCGVAAGETAPQRAQREERLAGADVVRRPSPCFQGGRQQRPPIGERQGPRLRAAELIAFRFSLACSSDWPPERKTIPGTAAGTVSWKQRSVQSATSSALAWVGEPRRR